MKIFIDTAPLRTGHSVRGVGSYTRNLVEALRKRKDVKLVDKDPEIVHIPYFDLFFDTLHLDKSVPTIVTIYDVIPLIYPKHHPPGIKGRLRFFRQKRRLKDVAAIITISETSKKDIVRFLDVLQEKIYVTHLAPAGRKTEGGGQKTDAGKQKTEVRKKYNLPEKFVLYVGDVNYNKNVEGLIRTFALLTNNKQHTTNSIGLVLVGKAFKDDIPETKKILHLIKELDLTHSVVTPGFIPDEDLVKIYNLATVYCQPSFYEGFGLPVLEAMAAGCPVVAAKTQALVEIAEDAAYFVNPRDANEIANAIARIYANQELRNKLRKKGLEHVKKFSWDKTAEATVAVYKKILQ